MNKGDDSFSNVVRRDGLEIQYYEDKQAAELEAHYQQDKGQFSTTLQLTKTSKF